MSAARRPPRGARGPSRPAAPAASAAARTPGLPLWSLLVVAVLFAPAVAAHEAVFGSGVGLRAAGAGVAVGLLIAAASTRWRWDAWSTVAVALAAHLLLGGAAALPETAVHGAVPTARTLQLLVVQPVHVWKDLLTLTPPASSYTGPAVLPWMTGLICALAAGLLTARAGNAVAGTLPVAVMAVVGIAWGPSGVEPAVWPVAAWAAGVLAWWAWASGRRRLAAGEDVLVGRRARRAGDGRPPTLSTPTGTTTGGSVSVVRSGPRMAAALATVAVAALVAVPASGALGPWSDRTVLRDVVEPPLDVQDYPSPLAAYRHYTTDLEDQTLLTVSELPEDARVRIAVMDTYDGTAFGMSDPETTDIGGYVRAGSTLPDDPDGGRTAAGDPVPVSVTTDGLIGPWVPVVGRPQTLAFTGPDAGADQDGLHVNRWSDAALTTGPVGALSYTMTTRVEPALTQDQLSDVATTEIRGTPDTRVPDGVASLAQEVAATEQTPLRKILAIERYLSEQGFYSNEDTAESRPGHRADRLARMLDADQMIGDDEQYAPLMALMLHSLGIPARVVMGAYPETAPADGSPVDLRGVDLHVWVEVEFQGVGWAAFDPTPPRDQVPQTDVPKPHSVPRPQVLQPPEPPEDPIDLPPSTTDRDPDSGKDQETAVPWGLIAGISGGTLLLLAPIAAVLGAKARRSSRRRNASEPSAAVAGSWDEVVDLAVDAGAVVPADLTRRESAWLLSAALWPAEDPPSSAPDWQPAGRDVPATVALAERADAAAFTQEGARAEDARAAWADVDGLRRDLSARAGAFTRVRRRLSLKSVRRRRQVRSARRRNQG